MADTTIATIPKNAREELRVGLSDFRGVDLLNQRVWYESREGEMRPAKDGYALRIEKLPELIEALQKVEAEARRLGLLPREG